MSTAKNYVTKFIRKLSDFIEDISTDIGDNKVLWFRGHTNTSYKLLPGIYRKYLETLEVKSVESELLSHFQARNYHLIPGRLPQNKMEWLCMMQHYNTATRLLDWTENAFTAFLFALEPYFTKKQLDQRILPCVWVLNPLKLNKINGIDHIPNMALLSQLMPAQASDRSNLQKIKEIFVEGIVEYNTVHTPLAVFSPYNNERIRAQSGVFTLFPFFKCSEIKEFKNNHNAKNRTKSYITNYFEKFAMEEHPECGKFLTKYVLLHPFKIYTELKRNGFKQSSIYPEMQVLSEEIEEYLLRV
ncbi:MAG: FRG domain-containing protein [Firmicutes bacterium]|nr:FRG domain-containing protein [Bacillota bacterium]